MSLVNHFFKLSRILLCSCKDIVYHYPRRKYCIVNYSFNSHIFQNNYVAENSFIQRYSKKSILSVSGKRFKHKIPKKVEESDSESEDEEVEVNDLKDGSTLITGYMTSLRADNILKTGLGMARNKVEKAFYENKIRVNGKKIPKKSYTINIDDEVDLIIGHEPKDTMMRVSRVVVVSAKPRNEKVVVKLRRYKHLLVENYEENDES